MGQAKREMEAQEDQLSVDRGICVRAQVLKQCEICDEITDLGRDPEEAYKLGNTLFTKNDALITSTFGTRRSMTDAIKQTHGEAQEHCRCYMRD